MPILSFRKVDSSTIAVIGEKHGQYDYLVNSLISNGTTKATFSFSQDKVYHQTPSGKIYNNIGD